MRNSLKNIPNRKIFIRAFGSAISCKHLTTAVGDAAKTHEPSKHSSSDSLITVEHLFHTDSGSQKYTKNEPVPLIYLYIPFPLVSRSQN
jgi:hypothetical protein